MLQSEISGGTWTLKHNGTVLLTHRSDLPFATVIRREKTYTANRGSVKETVTETERVPLTALRTENDSVFFSSGSHLLKLTMQEEAWGAQLSLEGEQELSYEFCLPQLDGEAVFGGGEQYRQINLRGESVVNLVSEHIKASTVIQKALLPRALYREKPHAKIGSYAPMPVFVTDRGRLFLFDTDSDGISRFGADSYRFTFDRCPNRILLMALDSYEALLRQLAQEYPNRQYLPNWCHDGMILAIQGGTDTVLQKTFAMLDAGVRVSAVWSQDWSGENRTMMGKQVWWNWEADETLYPNLKDAISKLNARGVRFLAYLNPYLVKDSRLYTECREKGYLITRRDGSVYHIKSTTFDAGMLDLTNPEAAAFIKDTLIRKNLLGLGVSGWMADFGEYLPIDCVLHDGDPALMHNHWPILWAKLNREAIEEAGDPDLFFFMRSGYLGIQSYAPILWNGDQHTDLTKDYGMPCVMPASFSLGFSGVPLIHSDIGGFFSIGKIRRDDELFVRWMEMCAFSLLMRSHESLRPWANSQFDAPGVLPHTVRLTQIHYRLKPYLLHCLEQAKAGMPALRPDFWPAMRFSACQDPYSYFLGDDLYVCPVIRRKAQRRKVHLPEGEWNYLWSGKPFEGGKEYDLPAPLGRPPVFYRRGSPYEETFIRSVQKQKNKE